LDKQTRIQQLTNWYASILILVSFTLPLSKKLVVLLLAVSFLFALIIPATESRLKQFFSNKYQLLCYTFFLLQMVGYFVTENKSNFAFELETKLSFLLMPILFRGDILASTIYHKVKNAFIQGCIIAIAFNLINSIYRFYISGEIDSFFYGNFSFNIHSSYFAAYLTLASAFILFSKKMRSKPVWWVALGFLALGVFLSSSRAGIISLLVVFLLFLFHSYIIEKNAKPIKLAFVIGFLIMIPLLFTKNFRTRLAHTLSLKRNENSSVEAATAYERIAVWKTAATLISKNILTGTGGADVRDDLTQEYQKRNMAFAEKFQLNCHNQYLQTLLANGFAGLIILLSILFIAFKESIKTKNYIFLSFNVIVFIGFIFESMLETQAGIVFFTFFLFYFYERLKLKLSLNPKLGI